MRCGVSGGCFSIPAHRLGNFSPAQALRFLQGVRQASSAAAGGLLIGIDLVKEPARLEAAYDDALGVTAAFNRNILLHVNSILGTDFNLRGLATPGVVQPKGKAG